MTSGSYNKVVNFGVGELDPVFQGGANDTIYARTINRKTWSGTNRPKTRKGYRLVHEPQPSAIAAQAFGTERLFVRQEPTVTRYEKGALTKRARSVENPYSASGLSFEAGRHRTKVTVQPASQNRNVSPLRAEDVMPVLKAWNPNKEIALAGKLREKIAGTDFNAGVFLGEGREALSLITSSAWRIGGALRALRRFDFVSAERFLVEGTVRSGAAAKARSKARWTDNLSSNWLQLQYGWLPLLKDVHDGAGFIAHHLSAPLQQVVRVSVSDRTPGTWTSTSPSFYRLDRPEFVNQVWIKATIREKSVVALSGLMDPLSIAWELMPYSFVVDWFIPIGNYLQARQLDSGINATYVVSRLRRAEGQGVCILSSYVAEKKSAIKVWDFSRTVSTTFSVPRPAFKPLSKVASWQHAANAVALLTGGLNSLEKSKIPEPRKIVDYETRERHRTAFRSLASQAKRTLSPAEIARANSRRGNLASRYQR